MEFRSFGIKFSPTQSELAITAGAESPHAVILTGLFDEPLSSTVCVIKVDVDLGIDESKAFAIEYIPLIGENLFCANIYRGSSHNCHSQRLPT